MIVLDFLIDNKRATQHILNLSLFISHQDRTKLCPITYTPRKNTVFKCKHKLTVKYTPFPPFISAQLRWCCSRLCARWFPLLVFKGNYGDRSWMIRVSEVESQEIAGEALGERQCTVNFKQQLPLSANNTQSHLPRTSFLQPLPPISTIIQMLWEFVCEFYSSPAVESLAS